MSIFQNVTWRYDLPAWQEAKQTQHGYFFFLPSISAETSWSKLFALVLNGGSKYDQVSLISISSCHSLPILATFYKKVGLFFRKSRKNSLKQGPLILLNFDFLCLVFMGLSLKWVINSLSCKLYIVILIDEIVFVYWIMTKRMSRQKIV